MTDKDKNKKIIPEDDNVSSDSIDKAHVIGLDLPGAHETYRKQNTDTYDIIEEGVQNAIDSKEIRKPHRIDIYRGRHPNNDDPTQWVLRIRDQGDGIAQDYEDDVTMFIEAKKAASSKSKKKFKAGFKGIGMFQFTEIGQRVVFRSMYKGLITKFYMLLKPTEDPKRPLTVFTRPIIVAATPENMDKYDIHENGTDIRWYDRPNHLGWIQSKKLIEKIQEDYSMRLIDNPQLAIMIYNDPSDKRGTRVESPERMKTHPPCTLGTIKDEYGEEHLVRGAIWKDEKSTGKLEAHRGHKIEEVWWDNRQATGYFECWALDVDSAKHTVVIDKTYNEVRKLIVGLLKDFPRAKEDKPEDPKVAKKILEMARIALAELLPKAPTSLGHIDESTKNETTGDPNGTSITGYRTSPEPDPNRIIIPRPGGQGIKHNMSNQSHVGTEGDVSVKIQDEDKEKRQKNPDLRYHEQTYAVETPLFIFFPGQSARGLPFRPAELILCKNNGEYPMYENMLKKPAGQQAAIHVYIQGFVEILREHKDPSYRDIRIEHSHKRVELAKAFGVYYGATNVTVPMAEKQGQRQRRLDE